MDKLDDVPEVFHPVVLKYGKEMYALVMNAAMAREAVERIGLVVQKHQSHHGMHGLQVLAKAFNQISNAYVKQMGWDEGRLAQCDRDIQLAFAGKLTIATKGIVLPGH